MNSFKNMVSVMKQYFIIWWLWGQYSFSPHLKKMFYTPCHERIHMAADQLFVHFRSSVAVVAIPSYFGCCRFLALAIHILYAAWLCINYYAYRKKNLSVHERTIFSLFIMNTLYTRISWLVVGEIWTDYDGARSFGCANCMQSLVSLSIG